MPPKRMSTGVEFQATISKGTLWRSILELMTNERITMHISKEGLSIGHENKPIISTSTEVCIILWCPAQNFEQFMCVRPLSVSFTTAEHHAFIRSIKKKAKLTIKINRKKESKIAIQNRVFELTLEMTPSSDVPSSQIEKAKCTMVCTEEERIEWGSPEKEYYRLPIDLVAQNFSVIKSFSSQNTKRIRLRSQSKPGYIGFFVDSGSTVKVNREFGEEMNPAPIFYEDQDGWLYCSQCEKYLDACKCLCELCEVKRNKCECYCPCGGGQYLTECACGCNPYEIVERNYPLGALLKLTKLNGMKLSFYEPKNPRSPLVISFIASYSSSILGEVSVLINDIEEIQSHEKE
jgi:hypothetical protein